MTKKGSDDLDGKTGVIPSPWRATLLTLLGILMVALADHAGLLDGINHALYDLAFRVRGPRQPNASVLIVAIDEKTLGRLGRWPLNRSHYTDLVNSLTEAKAIGLNLILAEPTPEDAGLAIALKRHGRTVLPTYLDPLLQPSKPAEDFAAVRTGHVHVEPGLDGIVREVFHTVTCHDVYLPSFAAVLHDLARDLPFPHTKPEKASALSALSEPILQTDQSLINFYGGSKTVALISMIDVLDGVWPPSFFKNKMVLVGATASGLEPGFLTPFGENRDRMSGVELHAQILCNLLDSAKIKSVGWGTALLALLGVTLPLMLAFFLASGPLTTCFWLASLAVIPLVVFGLFVSFNLWLPPASFYSSITIAFVVVYAIKLAHMGRMLVQAKDDWETSFDAISDAIFIHDKDGVIVRCNKAAGAIPPSLIQELRQRYLVMQKGNACPSAGEFADSDSGKFFAVKSFPRFDHAGGIAGMVQVAQDITDRKRSSEEQQKLQAQLIQAQKMESIGRLAGGVAHDFNNILSAILGYSELALRKLPEGHAVRENLRIIHEAGEKAAALTHQLLVFSRKQQLKMEPINLNSVVNHMGKMLQRLIGEDVLLELKTEDPVGNVLADPGQIEQILMNLAVNARDAMPNGGALKVATAEIEISAGTSALTPEPSPGSYIVLSVTDTGFGMTEEIRERIFEPFFSTKESGKGTGLGLATVYGIVQQHHGSLHVYSEVGKGTVFKIYLPITTEGIQEKPRGETRPLPTGQETILVAEDDPALRTMIMTILPPLGYKVLEASNGNTALAASRSHAERIDLLLTDVIMPGLNGRELADTLRKERPDLKILFMSGYTADALDPVGDLEREADFIQKPFTPSLLADQVRAALDRSIPPAPK